MHRLILQNDDIVHKKSCSCFHFFRKSLSAKVVRNSIVYNFASHYAFKILVFTEIFAEYRFLAAIFQDGGQGSVLRAWHYIYIFIFWYEAHVHQVSCLYHKSASFWPFSAAPPLLAAILDLLIGNAWTKNIDRNEFLDP